MVHGTDFVDFEIASPVIIADIQVSFSNLAVVQDLAVVSSYISIYRYLKMRLVLI